MTLSPAIKNDCIQSTEPSVTMEGAIHMVVTTVATVSEQQICENAIGKVPRKHRDAMTNMLAQRAAFGRHG